jgi:hypothetical protein
VEYFRVFQGLFSLFELISFRRYAGILTCPFADAALLRNLRVPSRDINPARKIPEPQMNIAPRVSRSNQCSAPLMCRAMRLPSTTTVVMKTLESEDEGVCGAHDDDNGCDEPRTASCVGRLTRVTAAQANEPVTARQSPISGAPRAPSSWQAHRLRSFFSLLAELDAGQPGMGHHRERDVPIPAVPEAHFVLI